MSFQIDDALTPDVATLDPSLTTAAIGALMLFPDDGDVQSRWLRRWQMEDRYAQRATLIREDLVSLLEQFRAGREDDIELEKLWRERVKLGSLVGMQTYLALAGSGANSGGVLFRDILNDMEIEGLIADERAHRRRAARLRPVCYLWAEWFRAGWVERNAWSGAQEVAESQTVPCEPKNLSVFLSNAIKLKVVGMTLPTHRKAARAKTIVPSAPTEIRHLPVELELWAVGRSVAPLDSYAR